MTDMTFSQVIEKRVIGEIQTVEANSEYYNHYTFHVNSLDEYIKLVTKLSSLVDGGIFSDSIVYRGIEDKEYQLLPSLARMGKEEAEIEPLMVNDFISRRPDAFSGLNDFDILAKMQHYGLPTRLLDFTENPLVALYFACESCTKTDGRVICLNAGIENDSSEYIKSICGMATRTFFDDNMFVDEYICNERLPLWKYISKTYLRDEITIIRPKYWNQRISNQSGLFMVFPNELSDRYRWVLVQEKEMGADKAIEEYGIGYIDKERILEALEKEPIEFYRGIGTNYISDDYVRRLADGYCKSGSMAEFPWIKLQNRFKMTTHLRKISDKKIRNHFCSIIIDADSKEKLLMDLSYIGVGADFIYPELEYTAQEIKRKYNRLYMNCDNADYIEEG